MVPQRAPPPVEVALHLEELVARIGGNVPPQPLDGLVVVSEDGQHDRFVARDLLVRIRLGVRAGIEEHVARAVRHVRSREHPADHHLRHGMLEGAPVRRGQGVHLFEKLPRRRRIDNDYRPFLQEFTHDIYADHQAS